MLCCRTRHSDTLSYPIRVWIAVFFRLLKCVFVCHWWNGENSSSIISKWPLCPSASLVDSWRCSFIKDLAVLCVCGPWRQGMNMGQKAWRASSDASETPEWHTGGKQTWHCAGPGKPTFFLHPSFSALYLSSVSLWCGVWHRTRHEDPSWATALSLIKRRIMGLYMCLCAGNERYTDKQRRQEKVTFTGCSEEMKSLFDWERQQGERQAPALDLVQVTGKCCQLSYKYLALYTNVACMTQTHFLVELMFIKAILNGLVCPEIKWNF